MIITAKVVAIINMKGGVGKTTLVVNLAWVLSELNHNKVLLVDLDPQFNATQYMMFYPQYMKHIDSKLTVVDIFYQPRQPLGPGAMKRKPAPPSSFTAHLHNDIDGGILDLVPSQLDLAEVIKSPGGAQRKLKEFVDSVKHKYDIILIDCGPTATMLTTSAFLTSHYVLVPVTPDPFAIIGFPLMEATIDDFRKNYPDPNRIEMMGVIFTNVEEDVTTEPSRKEIRKKAPYTFKNEMRYTKYYRHSVKNKTPLYRTPGCKKQFKEELDNISEEFIIRMEELHAKRESK